MSITYHWVVCDLCSCILRKSTQAEVDLIMSAPLGSDIAASIDGDYCTLCTMQLNAF